MVLAEHPFDAMLQIGLIQFPQHPGDEVTVGVKEVRARRVLKSTGAFPPTNVRPAGSKPALPLKPPSKTEGRSPVEFPETLRDRRITNPDAPANDHCMT